MKKVACIVCIISGFLLYDCSPGKKSLSKTNINPAKNTAGSVTSYDEPTYKTDRRLSMNSEDSTDNNGALGPGTGASYASYSYRAKAYKNAKTRQPARNSSLATYQSK